MDKFFIKLAYIIISLGMVAMAVFLVLAYRINSANFFVILTIFLVYLFLCGVSIGQQFSLPEKMLRRTIDEFKEHYSKVRVIQVSVGHELKQKMQTLQETVVALEQKVKNRTSELQKTVFHLEKFQEDLKAKEEEIQLLKKKLDRVVKKTKKAT